MINAEKVVVGPLETNCYIVNDGSCCAVIDPGAEPDKILAKTKGLPIKAILLTHGHFDHIGAVVDLKEATGAPVYMHEADADMPGDMGKNLGFMTGGVVQPFEPDVFVTDGDLIRIGEMEFKVYHTPGHSPGGVCYVLGSAIFGGDLIFRCSIGRYDHGNFDDEMASIGRILSSFSDDTLICPGHGPGTTVGYEKNYNPYI